MQERRNRQRLPSIRVSARVGIKRGLFGRDWLVVRVLDFSDKGVSFTGDIPLGWGDKFQMSLRLTTETGDFVVEKAAASVANVRDTTGQRVYGASFDEDNPAATRRSLEQVEGLVKRYKELSSRIHRSRPERKAVSQHG